MDRERIQVVSAGEPFNVKGIEIMAVGGTHAMIHPDIERTTNIGFYFTDSGLLHPGDDLTPPAVDVKLLALPVSGPWLSLADAVDYLRAINPPVAFAMHEAALTHPGFSYDTTDTLKPKSTKFQILEPGTPTELLIPLASAGDRRRKMSTVTAPPTSNGEGCSIRVSQTR